MKRRLGFRIFSGLVRFTAVILVIVALSLAMLIIAQRIFNPFHIVVNNSMSPQISKGDAVIIKDIEPNTVKVGEVISSATPSTKRTWSSTRSYRSVSRVG